MRSLEEIQKMLDENVNILLQQHGGRVEAIRIDNHPDDNMVRILRVKMLGGCQGCAGAKATLRSIIANKVVEFDNSIVDVVDDTDHSDKSNAFFK